MKKLLILCLAFVLFFVSCTNGGQNADNNSSTPNDSTQSDVSTDNLQSEDLNTDSIDDVVDLGDDFGTESVELKVNTNIIKPPASQDSEKTAVHTPDNLDPSILKEAGANTQALAMRKNVINAKDKISVKGTTYYVSPNGSDKNDGKSKSKPFGTLEAANASAKAGDAVLLERGSVFRLRTTVTLTNGVVYGAYGKGDKPEVWGSLQNYADSYLWNPYNIRNVWAMDLAQGDAGIVVFNHGELAGDMKYYVRNLKKNGDFFYDDVQKVLYLYCDKGNPGKVYNDIEIGSAMSLFRVRNSGENVTIDNISFKYTGTFAITGVGGCRNIKITNCAIGWIGGSLFLDKSNRYGNGIQFSAGCENLTVENCWIYQIYDAGVTFQITLPDGFAKEQTYKNIKIENNLIEYCSWAFEWWPSDDKCVIEDILVKDNIMRFTGYGWALDTRTPSHIRGPWSAKNFTAKNFVITENIFDCANGPIYAWVLYNNEQKGELLTGNAYYQKKPTSKIERYGTTPDIVFEFDISGNGAYRARNQQELEEMIDKIDSQATVIKWLD